MFPNLSNELEGKESKVTIDTSRTDVGEAAKSVSDKFSNYYPNIVDFLRRCDTKAQAMTIIDYLEKRGELTEGKAAEFRTQLRKEGVRSFGSRKEENYYFKQGGLY